MLEQGVRFEAGAYNIEARHAVEQMRIAGLALISLYGEGGLCPKAHNAFRFTRVWVSKERGYPFLSSSDIISMRPQIESYISRKLTKNAVQLLVKKWDVLISRSGTIGNVGMASDTWAGKAVSEDVIRVQVDDPKDAGYVTAFLRCKYGRLQIVQATYGSVIKHIEPLHLRRILIPEFKDARLQIGSQIIKGYELRDEANKLLDEADSKLHTLLKLPMLADVCSDKPGPVIVRQRASKLSFRFDASFHDPIAKTAEKILRKSGWDITSLSDPRVTHEIRAITKFRKRVYVHTGGIPMLSSKQLMQIDPVDIKRLAKGAHTKDLPEIALKRDMVTVSCSGTIGRVQIIPPYMEGWTANQHATRLIAGSEVSPGYLYAWLASDYGQRLLKRYSYGSVILEVDRDMIGSVSIPLPPNGIQKKIGDLVLHANELRDQAWRIERDAIQELENHIEAGLTRRPPRPV
jgi:type I restriction enzyme, S subunit